MEILSPVGASEQLLAAVRSGANAVYLGLQNFNARRNAKNFDTSSLTDVVKYCHARDVKVYITLNTLVKDSEITKLQNEIKEIAKAGVDAIIVQDFAVYRLAKEMVPKLPLHASTQMTIHNPSGAQALEKLGFSRVVPARELSLEELKRLRQQTNLELEVFVHGALCMCMSGACYLSGVLGQRSANRGMCAQPCRLDFKSKNRNHALSLKDLSVIDRLRELESIGINSAKIEGRMKRPEYVASSTAACVKALNSEDYDKETLKAVFSRSGFTDGYFTGKRNVDMFGYRTKDDVVSAAPILKNIANNYRNESALIGIEMTVFLKCGQRVKLVISDGKNQVNVTGEIPETAINKPTDEQMVKRALDKCGGTQYFVKEIKCEIDNGLSMPISKLNALRKEAIEKLDELRAVGTKYEILDYNASNNVYNDPGLITQKLYARFETEEQIIESVDYIIFDFEKIYKNKHLIQKYGQKLIAELPAFMFDEADTSKKLQELKECGITKIYASNLYAIEIANKIGLQIIGGYGLNIINSIALDEYRKLGVTQAELSFENTIEGFNKIQKSIPCGLIVYGKMPLMSFRNCPAKSDRGCGNCKCKAQILDRYNNEFTLLCKDRKYTRLLNPQPIYMGDKKEQLKKADFLTLYFTDEDQKNCLKIINSVKSGNEFDGSFTRGLYYKEIK